MTNFILIAELIVKGGTDYIMKNKFEILEQPKDKGHQEGAGGTRLFRTLRNFTHPIQTMVSGHNQKPLGCNTERSRCVYLPALM